MTQEAKIRGYSIRRQIDFIRSPAFGDESTRARALAALPAHLSGSVEALEEIEWYPWSESAHVLRAIASSQPDEAAAREKLTQCGEWIGAQATNTFLKLVMKLMNPARFANKLPALWERDNSKGGFTADVSDLDQKILRFELKDIEGFDHIAAVTIGWIRFAMLAMGQKDVEVKLEGWSLTTPAPASARYEVRWS